MKSVWYFIPQYVNVQTTDIETEGNTYKNEVIVRWKTI